MNISDLTILEKKDRALFKRKDIMRLPLIMETPNDNKCDDMKVNLDLIEHQ